MEMVGHNCSLESTAYCTSHQTWFVDVQLFPGCICSPCMGKGCLHVLIVQQLSILPSFWCFLILGSSCSTCFSVELLIFWYLLQSVVQDCGGPFVLILAPPYCCWADWCNYLKCGFCYHSTDKYYYFYPCWQVLGIFV